MGKYDIVQSAIGKEGIVGEPKYPGLRAMLRIQREGLWKPRDEEGRLNYEEKDKYPDKNRLIAILQEEISTIKKSPVEQDSYELPESDVLEELLKGTVNGFLSDAVRNGWMPMDVVMLTAKITRGSDIKIDNTYDFGLNYLSEVGGKPETTVPLSIIRDRVDTILRISKKNSIQITLHQAIAGAVASVGAHEYGHSFERAVGNEFREIVKKVFPDKIKTLLENTYFNNFANSIVDQSVTSNTPLLFPTMEADSVDVESISSERLATGFEFEALKFGLKATGVDEENVRKLVEILRQERYEDLIETSKTIDALQMDQVDIFCFTVDLQEICTENDISTNAIPSLWAAMGYFAGCTREQLVTVFRDSIEKLNTNFVTSNVEAILDEEKRYNELQQ